MTRGGESLRTVLMVLIGLFFVVLANLWVRQGELITLAAQATMAVPPVPALAALLLMLAGIGLLRKMGIERREVMAIYCFLTLAVALTSGAALRLFLPALTVPQYFASPENDFAQLQEFIQPWLVPHGEDVIRDYYEGSADGTTPWGAWIRPLGLWLVFFVAFYGLLICVSLIFRPVWEEGEHLPYPVAELPLMLAGYREDARAVWREPIFWVGFGMVSVHHLLNILNAFNPAVQCLGISASLSGLLQDWPLTVLQPLEFRYMPFVFGISYLMPTEVALSTVVFHFGYFKAMALGGAMVGISTPGFPFAMEQAAGAFIGMAIILVYAARQRIASVFSGLMAGGREERLLPAATLTFALVVFLFWRAVGMNLPLFLMYFALMLAFALSAARIRTEGGFPNNWIGPNRQEHQMLVNFLGVRTLSHMSGMPGLTAMSFSYFLSRGYMPRFLAFIFEAFRIGGQTGTSTRRMATLLLVAVVIGCLVSWWVHLSTAYQYGANVLEGGTTTGGARVQETVRLFDELGRWHHSPPGSNYERAQGTIAGFVMVLIIAGLRRAYLRFPLHPLGVLMAVTGPGINAWGPLTVIVLIKTAVMRIGGMRLYRRLIPLFLGIAVGDFFSAGFVWSLIASYGGAGFDRYPVWY